MRGRDETSEIAEGRVIITDLYNNHRRMAYRIIGDVLGDQISWDELDDLVQEGFYRMLDNLESLLGRSKKEYFRYMCSTMLHLAIDEGRRRNGHPMLSLSELLENEALNDFPLYRLDLEGPILSEIERSEAVDILYRALDKMEQQEYDLIVGYYFFDISDYKMGEWLDLKEAFVRVYRKRALKKLARKYKEVLQQKRKHRFDKS